MVCPNLTRTNIIGRVQNDSIKQLKRRFKKKEVPKGDKILV